MMTEPSTKYWVGCNSESAVRIYFNAAAAVNAQHEYLAMFDEKGNKIKEVKLVDDLYTAEF